MSFEGKVSVLQNECCTYNSGNLISNSFFNFHQINSSNGKTFFFLFYLLQYYLGATFFYWDKDEFLSLRRLQKVTLLFQEKEVSSKVCKKVIYILMLKIRIRFLGKKKLQSHDGTEGLHRTCSKKQGSKKRTKLWKGKMVLKGLKESKKKKNL